jgi:hypothetical protein
MGKIRDRVRRLLPSANQSSRENEEEGEGRCQGVRAQAGERRRVKGWAKWEEFPHPNTASISVSFNIHSLLTARVTQKLDSDRQLNLSMFAVIPITGFTVSSRSPFISHSSSLSAVEIFSLHLTKSRYGVNTECARAHLTFNFVWIRYYCSKWCSATTHHLRHPSINIFRQWLDQ